MLTTAAGPLANPESRWKRREALEHVAVAELEACLGERVHGSFELLSGGMANVNVRVGSRVVRIHRRDPGAWAREAALLRRHYSSFRVPRVLRAGEDFLVLEWVDHGPLLGTAEHGAAVGRALAEIHSVSFGAAGDLDASLNVRERFPDLVGALVDYACTALDDPSCALPAALRSEVARALRAAAPLLREVAGAPVLLHGDFKASNLHWASTDALLVLDWEFAYAGSRLSDIGQLLRWEPPAPFVEAFAGAYRAAGGDLDDGWQRWAATFDLVNVIGLVQNLAEPADRIPNAKVRDVTGRIEKTLTLLDSV